MNDPTYIKSEIDDNPIWKLAYTMSEIENDNAPLGWGEYIYLAGLLFHFYDIKEKKDES